MQKMNALGWVAWVLLFVGGLNWGLVGLFQWNLVEAVLGSVAWLERIVYILVGLSALYSLTLCHGESKPAAPAA